MKGWTLIKTHFFIYWENVDCLLLLKLNNAVSDWPGISTEWYSRRLYPLLLHCIYIYIRLDLNYYLSLVIPTCWNRPTHHIHQIRNVLHSLILNNADIIILVINPDKNISAKKVHVFYYTPYCLTLLGICLVMGNQNTQTKTWTVQLIKMSNK